MPLNEATNRPSRERWPLEFDLTGVPRDTTIRKGLIAQRKSENSFQEQPMPQVQNSFAVDNPAPMAITDINNPPRRNYNPNDPTNSYPKMVYHHKTGRVLIVGNDKEEKAALKRGFDLKPSPEFDYSKVSRSGIAAHASKTELREDEMSAEQLAALDNE